MRQHAPRRRGQRRPGQVGELMERNRLPSRRKARCRVPALEPRPGVVAAVWVVAVPDEVAGDLDLVRRVVDVGPGLRRLAQARLEQDGGDEQRDREQDCKGAQKLCTPGRPTPADESDERDREPCDDPGRPHEAEIPVTPGRTDERAEGAMRMHGRRVERPGIGSELRNDNRHERAERSEDRPGAEPADPHRARTASRGSVTAGTGRGETRAGSRNAAAIPSTSHVIGSSKNPLYASEWTNRAKKTAASDNPRAWLRRRTESSARAAPARIATYRRMPTIPSSAATVSGVVCETKFCSGPKFVASFWLARGCPPMPTPASGWCANTFAVRLMRRERSLVAFRTDVWATFAAAIPTAISATAAAATTATWRPRRSPATRVTARTTTKSAA